MKTQVIQELVRKIFSDKNTRAQFMANPDKVMGQFALTEQEKKAVLNTHARVGLVTSGSRSLEAALAWPLWF